MNIREVEELTGLVRANIRYYEDEGFFTPERARNGYRNYTDEDVRVLKRIKLLRMLEIPIEEIRRVQSDETLMRTVLEQSIRRAEEKKKELTDAQQICRKMNEDRVTWNTLEADRYLKQLGRAESEEESKKIFVYDSAPSEPYNLRRFAARFVDVQLYALIINIIYYLVLSPGIHLTLMNGWIINFIVLILIFLFEPFLLHKFGTTFGKWIFGIRVRHLVGHNLTLEEARRRTWSVLLWGYGLGIPIFGWIRIIKSLFDNSTGSGVPWDNGGEYELDVVKMTAVKQKILRIGGGILVICLLMFAQTYIQNNAHYPIHRGELTKAELAENINAYLDETELYWKWNLDENLNWVEDTSWGNTVVLADSGEYRPELQVVEKDGYVTKLYFEQTFTTPFGGRFNGHGNFIKVLMMAFGGAQPQVNFMNKNLKNMLELVPENPNDKFSATIAGIDFDYELINYSYDYVEGFGFLANGREFKLTVSFSMTLVE